MDRAFVDRYARGIGLLAYAIEGLTPEDLRARPGPGAWSAAQVVLHLLDSDLVGADRMKRLVAEENPTLLAYDETRWADRLFYDDQTAALAAVLFDLNRRMMLEILRRLPDEAFARAGRHSERGTRTLEQTVRTYAGHLDHHLKFIYEKRKRLARPIPERYAEES